MAGEVPQWALGEIVVTAQKRAQSAQDVGISIVSLTGDDLKNYGFEKPSDLARQTTNLVVAYTVSSNLPNFSLRGVGLNDFTSNNSSPVAVHLDEVNLAYSALLNFGLFDMERVEVLKGPQGTLYGRNTTGGTVNFHSNKPHPEFEAEVLAGYGRYSSKKMEGFINGTLGTNMSGRLSATWQNQSEGPWHNRFYDRDVGEIKRYAVRAQLLWTPNDDFSALLNLHGGREDSEGFQYSLLPAINATGDGLCSAYLDGSLEGGEADCFDFLGNQEPDDDPYTSSSLKGHGVVLNLQWDIGSATLTSVSGHEFLDRFSSEDADGFPQIQIDGLYQDEFKQWSQELRLASNSVEPMSWLIGALIAADEVDTTRAEFLGRDLFGPGFGDGANLPSLQETDSAALFAHTEWRLADSLRLIAGLRYTHEERAFAGGTYLTETPAEIGAGGIPAPGDIGPDDFLTFQDDKISFDNVSGKIGLDYRRNDDWLFYGSVSSGFKSGGFGGDFAFSEEELSEPFDEETILAYEFGFKGTLFDERLQWNGALFSYDYNDVILNVSQEAQLPSGDTFVFFSNANGADAEIVGLETDFWWRPAQGLDIRLGLAWMNTELKNALPGNEDLEGDELTYAPKFSANGSVRYEWATHAGFQAGVQLDASHKGSHFGEVPNSPVAKIDAYTLVNCRVDFGSQNGSWTIGLWGQNLTDETYLVYVNDLVGGDPAGGLGVVLTTAGYARTYGIDFLYRWR
jgi:iron complex outermembrane receptor protein